MSEALSVDPTEPAPAPNDAKSKLARVIEARIVGGYQVESLTETRAVLVVKGRKRFFGTRPSVDRRTEITIDDRGRTVTRDL